VASRKRTTFRVRVYAALVAFVIGTGFLLLTAIDLPVSGPAMPGNALFGVLTWLSLAAALSAGLFLTSDCVSEEKREGTLGLLFLTSLRGYDIVAGKLLATSIRGFHALLAIVPVLAITLLMGGITGLRFAKTSVALVAAFLASLAVGLFVSALSRDSQKSMIATLVLILVLAGGGPAADEIIAAVRQRPSEPMLGLTSPVSLFVMAGDSGRAPFWSGLLGNAIVAGLLLGLTAVLIRHTWQQRAPARPRRVQTWMQWWRFGGTERRMALRQRLLDVNPVLWLACRERWQAVSLWVLALLLVGAFAALFIDSSGGVLEIAWHFLAIPVILLLYLGTASEATRLFVEARRSGLLELMLSTPLSARRILEGQWRAWLRLFGVPLGLCLATLWVGMALVQHMTWSQMAIAARAAPIPGGATNVVTATNQTSGVATTPMGGSRPAAVAAALGGFNPPGIAVALAMASASILTVAANLAALGWFGLYMGLTSKSANLATLKTIVFVQVIPWFVIAFASALAIPLLWLPQAIAGAQLTPGAMMLWFPLIATAVNTLLYLAKDAAFILYAKGKLKSELRGGCTRAVGRVPPPGCTA
jgi:hypothetical protein